MLRWDGWEGMEPDLVTEQRLEAVLGGLARREPIFHRRELVNDRKSFERETRGTSGRSPLRASVSAASLSGLN